MTTAKTTTGDADLPARFQALSDAKRVRILEMLRDGEQCVCDLTEALDVGQSLLSFHLKSLKEAGLVNDRRDGRWVYYSLDRQGLEELRDRLDGLASDAASSGEPEQTVERCC